MASTLYRSLANRVGGKMKAAKAQTIFRKLVHASAAVEIIVSLGRRANNPLLLVTGYADIRQKIPWLDDRTLRFRLHSPAGLSASLPSLPSSAPSPIFKNLSRTGQIVRWKMNHHA